MTKKKIIWVCIALAVIAVIGVKIVRNNQYKKILSDAKELYNQGKYPEAIEMFQQLDEKTAQDWVYECNKKIVNQEAVLLMESGKAGEALALLKEKNPNSNLMRDTTEAYAKELVNQGKPKEALILLQNDLPRSRYIRICEQAIEEQRFFSLLEEDNFNEARECLKGIENKNRITDKLSEAQIEELWLRWQAENYFNGEYYSDSFECYYKLGNETGIKKAIEAMEAEEDYMSVFKAYQKLNNKAGMSLALENLKNSGEHLDAFELYKQMGDDEGMRSQISAMQAAEEYSKAFRCALEMEDFAWANTLFDSLAEKSSMISKEADIIFASEISNLIASDKEDANALAKKIVHQIIENCRALIADDERSTAYYALLDLQECAEALWTEEANKLKDSCVFDMPEENGIIRDTDLLRERGGKSTATITVYNKNRFDGVILCLGKGLSSGFVFAYVKPASDYTFTVEAGQYSATMMRGNTWFGYNEGFGIRAEHYSVNINNYLNTPKQGDRLEGSYYIEVK